MTECPHCGVVLTKHRSGPDHRRFFALVTAAFAQWPENHDFKPANSEQLRKWLLCEAGHSVSKTFELPEADPVMMAKMMEFAEALMDKAGDGHKFGKWRGNTLHVYEAKSLAWDQCGQREFAAVRSAVEDVIKAEMGLDADQLLQEHAT